MRNLLRALMRRAVRKRFPDVPQISTGQLSDWLSDDSRQPPVLLDVRSAEEFHVSHLPGAERVDVETPVEEVRARHGSDDPLVLYCAGGYRSSGLARRLQSGGFSKVANLDGAIFQWATEGRSLVGPDGSAVGKVHPVDWVSSKFVPPERRAMIEKIKRD